jgi:hypothetical protein
VVRVKCKVAEKDRYANNLVNFDSICRVNCYVYMFMSKKRTSSVLTTSNCCR